MKTVTIPAAEAAQFLQENGLLGEINRLVLHPRGLALAVHVAGETRDPTPQEVSELRKFVRTVLKTNVTPHTSKEGTTVTILKPQGDASGDQYVRVVDYLIKNGWVSWPSGDTKTLVDQRANAKKFDAFYNIALLKKAV